MPTALVSGGAVRLGRSIALHLAGRGYNIALHYASSRESAEQTAEETRKLGVQCKIYCVDFTNFDSIPLLTLFLNTLIKINGAIRLILIVSRSSGLDVSSRFF